MRLKNEVRQETVIKKSRFIACLLPVFTEEEARTYIEAIRKEYSDATHVCTAFIIGKNNEIQRSSDNHEPAGTAGVPMLEALLHSGITNTCACVIRYFGGIKLGAGGLIRAYSGAVTDALKDAAKLDTVLLDEWSVTYPYELSGTLEGWLRRNVTIKDIQYHDQVTCYFETQLKEIPDTIRDLSRGTVQPVSMGQEEQEVDV